VSSAISFHLFRLKFIPVSDCVVFFFFFFVSRNSFVVVCGDGEYIIYTALAWRNKSFGSALEFVWSYDSNE
jgi:hypothetical protein